MAYLKSQRREFEKNRSDSSQIPVAEQALNLFQANDLIRLISCDTKLEHSKLNCIY